MTTTRKAAAALALKQMKNENSLMNLKGQGLKAFLGIDKKRPADRSPPNKQPNKRSMLGDITNRENKLSRNNATAPAKKTTLKASRKTATKKTTKSASRNQVENKDENNEISLSQRSSSQSSQESSSQSSQESKSSQEDSYYTCEQFTDTLAHVIQAPNSCENSPVKNIESENEKDVKTNENSDDTKSSLEQYKNKMGIVDVDKENMSDLFHVGEYAYDIFEYYKEREMKFMVSPYLERQTEITIQMRAIVVDWLVEIQENFELNHETLYLAIRLFDLYLSKVVVRREKLQLVATAALFISCKFDERCPPLLDDFLYICDDAYNREQIIRMEQHILRTMCFDIGLPSSYRFLRRFSKCCKSSMELLTMARYILEYSQMDYNYLIYTDSELAAACLLLAFKMKKSGAWSQTLVFYTGFTERQLMPLAKKLNRMLAVPPFKNVQTIKTKYSHKVFFEVAKTPAVPESDFDVQQSD
ncbi:G2/mitotic-specific cyclin-B3-like [Tubulanus polymorphus]|uniref:G2/mitotic-specific cyclin-B3-like n=1 Tax=Tubulanus polymorphus TaxID=672921 RepID=UPI003DA5FFD1